MSFGPNHYVPVLKLKRGEKAALGLIDGAVQRHVAPFLEVVEMDGSKTLSEHLDTGFKDLADSVRGFPRFFIDAREIAPEGAAGAADAFGRASRCGIPFTPVTGLSRSVDVRPAIAAAVDGGAGLALRVTREDIEGGTAAADVTSFLRRHGLGPAAVDLVLDLGAVDQMVQGGVERLARAFMQDVPTPSKWRTLTLISFAFPMSMKGVHRDSHDQAPRVGWLAWRDGLYRGRNRLARLPTFGDGAIQHPAGVEGFNPRIHAVSAAVRYTLPAHWLLIKGHSTRVTGAKHQFPLLAAQLVSGQLKNYFAGASHCAGCAGMAQAAAGAPRLGSAEVWRRLGTAHHITTAAEQVQALAWP